MTKTVHIPKYNPDTPIGMAEQQVYYLQRRLDALVKAGENYFKAKQNMYDFEREHPNDCTVKWDKHLEDISVAEQKLKDELSNNTFERIDERFPGSFKTIRE